MKAGLLRTSGLSLISLFLLCASPGFVRTAEAQEAGVRRKNPVVITSVSLFAEKDMATFTGNVIAKTDDMVMYADKMLVKYGEAGKISTVEAVGNVRVIKATKVITSESALYDTKEDTITLTGGPKLVEGENIIMGTKITFAIKENKTSIEDSRVLLKR